MEYSFKKNDNKPIYSNVLPFKQCINYLSKNEVSQISNEELFNSYKYICSCSQHEQRQSFMEFCSVTDLLSKNKTIHSHTNSINHYLNEEKFFDLDLLVKINSHLVRKKGRPRFNYNDDNFNHLCSANLINYSTNYHADKLRNSNFFNNERAKNILWRQMFIKNIPDLKLSKQNPNCDLNDLYSIIESHFSLKKFSTHKDEKLAYLAITVPDQHLIFNAPLVKDSRLCNINVNNRIEYKHSAAQHSFFEENFNLLNENNKDDDDDDDDDDNESVVGSFESIFSFTEKDTRSSSLSSTIKYDEEEENKPSDEVFISKDLFIGKDVNILVTNKQSSLRSCLKNKTDFSTLENAKELLVNYHNDVKTDKLYSKKKTVMFSTEISCARIMEYLHDEEKESRLLRCKNLERSYISSIQELRSSFETISNYYYSNKNSQKSEQEKLKLKIEYNTFNKSINRECEILKLKYKRNKSKMIRLRNGRTVVKLKKKYLKDGHFVENLSDLKLEKLMNVPEFKNHFSVRYNKYILLRNIITQDDLEYLMEFENWESKCNIHSF